MAGETYNADFWRNQILAAQQAAQAAYQAAMIKYQNDSLAHQAAVDAADNVLKSAQIFGDQGIQGASQAGNLQLQGQQNLINQGSVYGNQALQATQQAGNLAQGIAGLMAQLRGPRNAFTQQEVLNGLNDMGLSRAVDALTGKYAPPSFQANQNAPQAASLNTLAADMGGNSANSASNGYGLFDMLMNYANQAGNTALTGAGPATNFQTGYSNPAQGSIDILNSFGNMGLNRTANGFTPYGVPQFDPNSQTFSGGGPQTDQFTGMFNNGVPSSSPAGASGQSIRIDPSTGQVTNTSGSQVDFLTGMPAPGSLPTATPGSGWGYGGTGTTTPGATTSANMYPGPIGIFGGNGSVGNATRAKLEMQQLPPPNKINPVDFNALDPSSQQYTLGLYEAAGYDPNDVLNTIHNLLPQKGGPSYGLML